MDKNTMRLVWYAIIFVLLASLASASCDEIQISKDNMTWYDFNATIYQGELDGETAIAQLLEPFTEYFVRGKNSTTEYGYLSFTTEDDTQMVFPATIVGTIMLGMLIFFISLIIFYRDSMPVKMVGWLGVGFTFILAFRFASMFVEGATGGITSTTQQAIVNVLDTIYGIAISVFIFGFSLALIWIMFHTWKLFGDVSSRRRWLETRRRKQFEQRMF